MEETTFFEYEGVKVTNARFQVDGQTFAMSNVTSVSSLEEPPKRFAAYLLVLFGVGLFSLSMVIGLLTTALGVYLAYKQEPKYHVMLRTSGGEAKALTTNQKEYLNKVVAALNSAIVHRG